MPDKNMDKYLILPEEYTLLKAGGKSNNLNKIRGKIEPWINLPNCITMQFNAAEEIIEDPVNSNVNKALKVNIKCIIGIDGKN